MILRSILHAIYQGNDIESILDAIYLGSYIEVLM